MSQTEADDASRILAERSAQRDYNDLSDAEIFTAKAGILDTLGVCLAATGGSASYLDPVRRFLATSPDGAVPAPTLGRDLVALDAMLWLGSLGHTLDFDDVAGYSHPSSPAVSAALAVGHDRAVDGQSLITSVALGQDIVIRLAQSVRAPISQYGWLPSMPGIFGAMMSTAKLLRMDAGQMRNAYGLTLHQASGTMQALAVPGSAYRAVREGFTTRAGALSAYLAAEGMPGDGHALEGQFGYFNQFFQGDYDPDFLHGDALLGPTTSFKPWPCAGHPQLFVTVLAEMMSQGSLDVDNIRSIRISGCSDLLPKQCEPIDQRSAPQASIDAKVSIPFLIGKILTHGTIQIDDFSAEGLNDAQATALGRRVEWSLDPSLRRGMNDFGVGIVEVEHQDGRVVRGETMYPLGHPENPLSWDEIVTKFSRCLESAPGDLGSVADEVVKAVENLDTVSDVRVLLDSVR